MLLHHATINARYDDARTTVNEKEKDDCWEIMGCHLEGRQALRSKIKRGRYELYRARNLELLVGEGMRPKGGERKAVVVASVVWWSQFFEARSTRASV